MLTEKRTESRNLEDNKGDQRKIKQYNRFMKGTDVDESGRMIESEKKRKKVRGKVYKSDKSEK